MPTKSEEMKSDCDIRYIRELLNTDTPFCWELTILDENQYEQDLEVVENKFSFLNFASRLLKSYNKYEEEDFKGTLYIIDNLDKTIKNLHADTNSELLLKSIIGALKHVIFISKATVHLRCNENEKCFKVLEEMKPFSKLNEKEEAAVLAIRSACCAMYSYKGTQRALDFIHKAVLKDSSTPFWRFLKASYLYKLRIVQNPLDPPTSEERTLLQNVNDEEKNNPLYMIYLADVYREFAFARRNRKELYLQFFTKEIKDDDYEENTEKMYKNSKMLYEKAYELRPQCPLIAFRCSNGLLKISQPYQNIELAKQIINDLLPKYKKSGYGNMVSAFYYHNFEKNSNLAEPFLEEAKTLKVFNAYVNFIKVNYQKSPKNYNAVDQLEKMLNTFYEAPKRKIIFSQIISYYIFVKHDNKLACENTIKYLKEGGPKSSLERHYSFFINTKKPISLIDVVTDEINYELGDRKLPPDLRKFFEDFGHAMIFYNIFILKGKPQNLRNQILKGKVPSFSHQGSLNKNWKNIKNKHTWNTNKGKYPNNSSESNVKRTASKVEMKTSSFKLDKESNPIIPRSFIPAVIPTSEKKTDEHKVSRHQRQKYSKSSSSDSRKYSESSSSSDSSDKRWRPPRRRQSRTSIDDERFYDKYKKYKHTRDSPSYSDLEYEKLKHKEKSSHKMKTTSSDRYKGYNKKHEKDEKKFMKKMSAMKLNHREETRRPHDRLNKSEFAKKTLGMERTDTDETNSVSSSYSNSYGRLNRPTSRRRHYRKSTDDEKSHDRYKRHRRTRYDSTSSYSDSEYEKKKLSRRMKESPSRDRYPRKKDEKKRKKSSAMRSNHSNVPHRSRDRSNKSTQQ